MYLKKLRVLGFCQALCRAYLSYLLFGVASGLSSKALQALRVFSGLTEAASQRSQMYPWGLNGWFPMPEAVPSCGGNIWRDKEVQHKVVSKFQLSELMWTSPFKDRAGWSRSGLPWMFLSAAGGGWLPVILLLERHKILLCWQQAVIHSSATLGALSWGLHFPLGRVFVKGCAGRGVTCSSWKLLVVTAWGPRLRTFVDLISWRVVFLVVTALCPSPAHLQRSLALSPPKLCSSTERTGHFAHFSKARGDEWIALSSVHKESEVMVMDSALCWRVHY